MKKIFFLFFLVINALSSTAYCSQKMTGKWQNIKNPDLILEIKLKRGLLQGYLYTRESECSNCADYSSTRLNQNIIYFKFKKKINEYKWIDGVLFDPFDGKKYTADIHLLDSTLIIKQRHFFKFITTKWTIINE